MLDKTEKQLTTISGGDLAIGIQLAGEIGQSRALTLTTAIPLDYSPAEINDTLDKLSTALERQRLKHQLVTTRDLLKAREQDLIQARVQYADQEARFVTDWGISGKRGEWKPHGNQEKVLYNLRTNESNITETIKKLRKEVEELEQKCR